MTLALSALIDNTQAALGDTGATYFTDAIVTAALRAALMEVNERAPIHAADLVTVIADQKEYEVTDFDAEAVEVLDVLKQDASGEDDEPLTYDAYTEDARLFFRLREAEAGGTLVVRYTKPHTINGLDSAIESTIPAMYDSSLVMGAAYHACIIRSVARVETNDLNKADTTDYHKAAEHFRKRFDAALLKLSAQQAPVGEPRTDAWNDKWHGRSV
jgi:hypothetical protein